MKHTLILACAMAMCYAFTAVAAGQVAYGGYLLVLSTNC